jgi:hypothetical protein
MKEFFFFTTAFRPILESSQSPKQWVTGGFYLGGNAEVKNAGSNTSIHPIRLHGVVFH